MKQAFTTHNTRNERAAHLTATPGIAKRLLTAAVLLLAAVQPAVCGQQESLRQMISRSLATAERQCIMLGRTSGAKDSVLPRTFTGKRVRMAGYNSWICGFYPGTLWLLYEHSGNDSLRMLAEKFTARVEPAKRLKNTHDLGFMLHCSFGNGYRITGNKHYLDVMAEGARNLAARYNERVGAIQSWGTSRKWQFPVIIDNMMNLEFLEFMAKETGELRYDTIARRHANTTMANHFRRDYSSYHVVSYDTITGKPHAKHTHQGYADESAWARGQAWALYGYTMMYRETGVKAYLNHARRVANYITRVADMPEDKVPYWDFDAPERPDACRDASAAAVMASAFMELSVLDKSADSSRWFDYGVEQLRSLSSPEYMAAVGENGCFLLMHSVGNMNKRSEVDAPLTYADYYFVEALLRLKRIIDGQK